MGELPCTRPAQDHELNESPLDHTRICCLRLVAELCFSFLDDRLCQYSSAPRGKTTAFRTLHPIIMPISAATLHTTYSLEHLLPLDILQSSIQIPHLLHNIVNLALVRALNTTRLANSQIQRKFDRAPLSCWHATT